MEWKGVNISYRGWPMPIPDYVTKLARSIEFLSFISRSSIKKSTKTKQNLFISGIGVFTFESGLLSLDGMIRDDWIDISQKRCLDENWPITIHSSCVKENLCKIFQLKGKNLY